MDAYEKIEARLKDAPCTLIPSQAANLIEVHDTWIRRAIQKGYIEATSEKINGQRQYFIPKKALATYVHGKRDYELLQDKVKLLFTLNAEGTDPQAIATQIADIHAMTSKGSAIIEPYTTEQITNSINYYKIHRRNVLQPFADRLKEKESTIDDVFMIEETAQRLRISPAWMVTITEGLGLTAHRLEHGNFPAQRVFIDKESFYQFLGNYRGEWLFDTTDVAKATGMRRDTVAHRAKELQITGRTMPENGEAHYLFCRADVQRIIAAPDGIFNARRQRYPKRR